VINPGPEIIDSNLQDSHEPNRGYDNRRDDDGLQNVKVELEDVDTAIINYVNQHIQPWVKQDDTRVIMPLVYANPERWKAVQRDGVLRDKAGVIQLPLMMIRRTSMKKNKSSSPVNRYLSRAFAISRWNRRNAYDRFAVVNGITPSQQYLTVVYPDYYDITYECVLWTAFQSQMNHVVEQISFEVENYWGIQNGYRFKTSVDEYTMEIDLPENADRTVRTKFTMVVKAYILPEDKLDEHGSPENLSKLLFSPKKIVIEEKFITE